MDTMSTHLAKSCIPRAEEMENADLPRCSEYKITEENTVVLKIKIVSGETLVKMFQLKQSLKYSAKTKYFLKIQMRYFLVILIHCVAVAAVLLDSKCTSYGHTKACSSVQHPPHIFQSALPVGIPIR